MGATRQRREDRAEVILDAAEALLRRSGSRTLTIDAVAAEAGLSKGGVLHHYASKDALVTALAARKVERMSEGIGACAEALRGDPAALPLAMIAHARGVYAEECGFPDSLLVATAENDQAVAIMRGFLDGNLASIRDVEGHDGAGAALLFAVLGLMTSRSLGFHALEGEELERLFSALEAQARALPRQRET